jgi:hypothetical protein
MLEGVVGPAVCLYLAFGWRRADSLPRPRLPNVRKRPAAANGSGPTLTYGERQILCNAVNWLTLDVRDFSTSRPHYRTKIIS